jgi:PTS system mannose-specific IID component
VTVRFQPGEDIATPGMPRGVRWSVFVRSLALQASWNHQRMQNLGLLFCLMPWLRRRPRDAERDRLFCRRYYEFFNTNPYLAGYVMGGLLRLEQEREGAGGLPRGQAQTYRDSLARALASLGDQLFWLGVRPAVALLGCVLALAAGRVGLVALAGLALLVVAGQLVWRWQALGRGYAAGYDIVVLLGDPRWHRAIAGAKRATMVLAGILAGWFLKSAWAGAPRADAPAWFGLLVLAGIMALPQLARRRWSGEFIILAAAVLGVVLTFALGAQGS